MGKLIKVYGERNTNTTYVSKLIKLNLQAVEVPGIVPPFVLKLQKILPGKELVRDIYFNLTYRNNLGWKHTCVKPFEELSKYINFRSDLVFLTITKNPYSWLLSLYRRPYHQYYSERPSFETFLQRPWKTIGRDNTKPVLKSPIELWNIKNKSYLQLKETNTLNVTTESIFENPESILENISRQLSIKRISDRFVNYERSTKDKSKDSNYYRNYYLSEKWRDDLSSDAIAIINESIDIKLMSHFGYKLLPYHNESV
ncbi:hypothetical protein ACFL2E_05715 [Thermodesulfobacteriota bacterium]